MFSMCSELTPRAHIRDTRIPQLMQPWLWSSLPPIMWSFPSSCVRTPKARPLFSGASGTQTEFSLQKKVNNSFNFCNQMKNIETSKVFPSISEIISLCLNVTKTDEVFIRAVGMERLPLLEVWSTTWHWTFQLHLFVGALFLDLAYSLFWNNS